jgi:hypothetical protein
VGVLGPRIEPGNPARNKELNGAPWPDFVKEHFNFGRSRADELIQIADGRTTVEKVREGQKLKNRQLRAEKPPVRTGGSEPEDDTPTIDKPPRGELWDDRHHRDQMQ